MIRLDYPVTPLTQIRLRLSLATRRTKRALEERRRSLRAEAQARRAERDAYLRLRWRQDLERERRSYATFYEEYDALIGLLCLAAHEGFQPPQEDEYRSRRAWFCAHYPDVKRLLGAHLEGDPSDTIPGRFGRRACDAFEALFFPTSLERLLAADEGNLIGRLMRTQAALTAWEAALRHKERACRR